MDIFSQRLKQLRDARGKMTQQELGDAVGYSRFMISAYENGRDPTVDVLVTFARFFAVSADYLCGLTNDKQYAGDDLNEALLVLGNKAGDTAITASELSRLIMGLILYYQEGATCGDTPMTALRSMLLSFDDMLTAIHQRDNAALLDHTNKTVIAALELTKLPHTVISTANHAPNQAPQTDNTTP